MKFERGNDVKDTLKIGRKAHALKVDSFFIVCKIRYSNSNLVTSNLGFTSSNKRDLHAILKTLQKGKINILRFKKIFVNHYNRKVDNKGRKVISRWRGLSRSIPKDIKNIEENVLFQYIYINVLTPYDPYIDSNINRLSLIDIEGKDLLFDDILYPMPAKIFDITKIPNTADYLKIAEIIYEIR